VAGSPKRVLPWLLSGAALLIVACCVVGFYFIRRHNDSVVKLGDATPSPAPSPVTTAEPVGSPVQHVVINPTPIPEVRTQKKTETPRPTQEAKKQATPEPVAPPPTPHSNTGHESDRDETPEVPKDSPFPRPGRSRVNVNPSGAPTIMVGPNGSVIRTFPDGSKMISSPDGSRVYISPDGRRQVLYPGRQQNKRRAPTTP